MTQIRDLDAHSTDEIRTFWEVEQAAHRADRTDPVLRSLARLTKSVTEPTRYVRNHWLVAQVDDEVVGVAQASMPLEENTHLVEMEISVAPIFRRRGVGTALHAEVLRRAQQAGRTTLIGEMYARPEGECAANAFTASLGYTSQHLEHHLRLDLTKPHGLAGVAPGSGYEVLTWQGGCPEEYVADYLQMRNQMNTDVPTGELTLDVVVMDADRLRQEEARLGASYDVFVAAARAQGSGEFAGYSLLLAPRDGDFFGWQDDTLVMPAHRGNRLGLALKSGNLEQLLQRHPHCPAIHTWTDPTNTAMYRTNAEAGFEVVEVMHEMELTLT